MMRKKQGKNKVDGFVKTIFPSFLDALPRDEWLPPAAEKNHPFFFPIRPFKKYL
jgi:hypothetical protein